MITIELYNNKPYIKIVKQDKIIMQDLSLYMKQNNIKELKIKTKGEEPRSSQQNKALHLYLTFIAESLNNAGLDIKHTIKADTDWTMSAVKELMWRPLQKVLIKKESSANLTKEEFSLVQERLDKILLERFGLDIKFPSEENK